MPNHVINEITLHGSEEEIQTVLKAVQKDNLGIGTIDFNKLLPMPPELNIEAGSRTDRGLKYYRDFVEVFTLGGTMNMEKLAAIPKKSEAAFLRQRPEIPTDEWELGKATWNNIRRFGSPTWYEWCIGHWGTKWNSYGMEEAAFGRDEHMSVTIIQTDELRKHTEGLVLQGCGGDLNEWVDGINELLTKDGILQGGTKFTDCFAFSHKGTTCLLFPFTEDVELNLGKLAMWRLQTRAHFGGTWLSDFVSNQLPDKSPKPDCPLIGQDGNIFNLLGIAARTLRENDRAEQAMRLSCFLCCECFA